MPPGAATQARTGRAKRSTLRAKPIERHWCASFFPLVASPGSPASARDDQLVRVERQPARRLRRLPARWGDLFDEIDLPAFLQNLLARQRTQARSALELFVVARELVVIDRRRAGRGPGFAGGNRLRRFGLLRLLHQLRVVADLFPFFPAVLLAVHPDRIARAKNERRRRGLREH